MKPMTFRFSRADDKDKDEPGVERHQPYSRMMTTTTTLWLLFTRKDVSTIMEAPVARKICLLR